MKSEEYLQNNIFEDLSENTGCREPEFQQENKSEIQDVKEEIKKSQIECDNFNFKNSEPFKELDDHNLDQKQQIIPSESAESKKTYFENWVDNVRKQNELGAGAEKQVFVHPEDPNKAVAVFFKNRSILEIKERFYANKILHILYPNIIPDIHLASTSPSVLIIDRVKGNHLKDNNLVHRLFMSLIKKRFERIGVSIDKASETNFMIDKTGKIFYVDGFLTFGFRYFEDDDNPFSHVRDKRKPKIIRLLKKINKLEPESRKVALNYFKRIQTLSESKYKV